MQLIVDGEFVGDSWHWQTADGRTAPPRIAERAGPDTVDLPLPWITHWFWPDSSSNAGIGVGVSADTPAHLLLTTVLDFALISISFTTLNDGRGFSLAHALREQRFTSELRAMGALIPDQYQALRQSGFDSIMLDAAQARRHTQAAWQRAATNPTQSYVPVWRQVPAGGKQTYPQPILARRYAAGGRGAQHSIEA